VELANLGLTFNAAPIALPKLVNEQVGEGMPLIAMGWLATGIFLCGGLAQLAVGWLVERAPPDLLFAASRRCNSLVWCGPATSAVAPLARDRPRCY
jgi:hypothetical protein